MPVNLPDLNVLLALAWPAHIHHEKAQAWLAQSDPELWATCAMTQVGFVRISCNRSYHDPPVSPQRALEMLQQMTSDARHIFWESKLEMREVQFVPADRLLGHRQVTDAYLLGLCLKQAGRLVTLDGGILSLARTPAERAAILHLT